MLLEVPLDRVDAVERAVDDETQGLVVLAEVGSSGFFSAPMASAATKLTLLWRPRSIAIVESTMSVTTNAQSSGARTYCAASKVSAALASAGAGEERRRRFDRHDGGSDGGAPDQTPTSAANSSMPQCDAGAPTLGVERTRVWLPNQLHHVGIRPGPRD